MNQVCIRNSPPSRTSRSPSADPVPHPNRRKNRQITIIDGDFQTQKEGGGRTPQSSSSSLTPSPRTSPAVEGVPSANFNGSVPTHGVHYGQVHIHQRSLTIPIRSSVDRSSAISDTKSSGTSDTETSSTTHNHADFLSPPLHSPIGYRSSGSSTSSLVDANMGSLVQKPTSEQSILSELKRQMTKSFRHHRVLERKAGLVPKLRMDIEALQKEREQLMNELLDQRAVVMQLKQRVSLLHGQNLQLAKLAQSEGHGGRGGSTQVLAIRNTLVATLAQLKQMEDQVQSIPGLKNRLRDLELENERLKEKEQQLVLQIPSDLPEGVSASDYKTLTEENIRLKAANQELVEEMDGMRKHLQAVSESCDGLQKRMELFHSSQVGTRPLQERIKRLEAEKDSLCQEIIHLKLHDRALTDIDTAHLRKEVMTLQKANSSLQSKLEQRKIESRQQKEQLLLKLFEIEALNIKTSKYELEKQALGVEQVHLLQSDPDHLNSTPLSPDLGSSDVLDEDCIMDISPEAKVQLLRFKQLEVHIQESQTLLKTFMSDKAELESKVAELGAQLEEKGVADLQNSLHEASDKLQLARERIEMLEEELRCNLASNPDQAALAGENSSLKTKIAELQKEVQRLSEVEMSSMKKEEQLFQLEDTQRACEKLKSEKQKVEKKAKERRHRLHSVASDLAKSAQLVKNYQEQCSSLQQELEMAHQEMESVRSELSSTKAQLEVKEVELRSTLKQQGNMESSPLTELQEKYDLLSQELGAVQNQLADQTHKLGDEEQQLEEVKKELTAAISKEKELKEENHQLQSKITQVEENLRQALREKEEASESMKMLQTEVEKAKDLEENLAKLQQEKLNVQEEAKVLTTQLTSLQDTISTLTSEKASLQQKVDILRDEAPLLAQETADLKVAKDEAERRIQAMLAEQEACSAKAKALEEKLHATAAFSEDVKNKVVLLQSDLEVAESELDQVREEKKRDGEEIARMRQELKSLKEQLFNKTKGASEAREKLVTATEKVKKLEKQRDEQSRLMEEQKKSHRSQEAELKQTQTETIPKLQAELAETVSQMNQLAADYSSRVAHIRELDSKLHLSDDEKQQLSKKLTTTERELAQKKQTVASLRKELARKEAEFQQLTSAHTAALASSQSFSAEVKELKEKVQRSQAENAQGEISTLRTTLQHRELQLHKTQDHLAIQMKEQESLRKKMEELTNQCVGLTATKENLLRRLDRMEKMEMEYERLKQVTAGGNTALLEMLEGVKNEMPKKLQEENAELHQQVSTLSQWIDKHQQQIDALEKQLETTENEKDSILAELFGKENCEQENQQLRKELREVEVEVNRLKRQAHTERQEEMKMKLQTQTQLIELFNEHNNALQRQVTQLQEQVKVLGGQLEREKPVSPPPMPAPLISITDEFDTTVDASRVAELESDNAGLKQRVAKLEAELFSAQELSPKIRRRSSTLLVSSSIRWTPINEDAFVSVPEMMLLPCSLLSDAFTNGTEVEPKQMEEYQQAIRDGWFSCIGQKSVTAECVKSYTTTFMRLSSKLLEMIINMQDMRGNTALHHLLANGNLKAVDVLMQYKCCNPNLTNRAGYTPLMMMAAHKVPCSEYKPVIEKLLRKTDTTIRSKVDQLTALMLAASSGNVELVPFLLEAGADINAQDKDGSTALMCACENSNVEIVQLLLADPQCNTLLKDNDGKSAEDVASAYGNPNICALLKKHTKQRKR